MWCLGILSRLALCAPAADSHHLLVAGEYPAHWVIAKTCLDPSWPVAPDTQRYAVMTLANLAADGATTFYSDRLSPARDVCASEF
eukprot:COSAG02_NODE_2902_length_7777_cov_3.802292_4_plen_85_part_00